MAKIVLDNVTGGYDLSVINNNFDKIETEFQNKVLYRDNPVGEANTLQTDIDANSKRIYNLPEPLLDSQAARLQDVQNAIAGGAANLITFTPYGHVAGSNVQAAIQELVDDTTNNGVDLPTFLKDSSALVVDNITALKAVNKTKFTKALVLGYYTKGDGGGGIYWFDSSDTTSVDNGGTIIVGTDSARWKLTDTTNVNLKQFGAKGDGVTDDTASILKAINYLTSSGNNIFISPGTYLTDPFSINSQTYAGQASFIGSDRERCILKRRTAGAGAFITYGSISGTIFQSGVGFCCLTFDGGELTNGNTFAAYDVVRSTFHNVRFTGGDIACHLFGGISLSFFDCLFDLSVIGVKIEKFTSLAGGGWPNVLRFIGGEVVDNTEWGVWFDDGRALSLEGLDIEGNGTTLGASQGGVFVGFNIGTEVSISDTVSIGINIKNCWFEANKGSADVTLNSGINSIEGSSFFSTSTQVTNDISISGGRYNFKNLNISFSKTANLLENSGALTGNIIENSDIPNITVNSAKTIIISNNKFSTRGGVLPIFSSYSIPFEQFGSGTTSAGITTSVTFATPFASAPRVFTEVNNGDSSTSMIQIVVSGITTTGFTVRALSLTSGSSTISSITAGFNWRAVGTL